MIESTFHPCDEIERWGYTAHGLVHGGLLDQLQLRVDDIDFALPFEWPRGITGASEMGDTHLVRVPGIADVDITAEEFAAEQAVGRTWQNYALLSTESLILFGHALEGWVCIDSTGARWLISADPIIRAQTLSIDVPLTLNLQVRPFGYLDEAPVDPVELSVTLAQLGQTSENGPATNVNPLLRQLRVGSISSDGRRAIIEIHGVDGFGLPVRGRLAPAGVLMLEVTGDGPNFTFTLSVLRTQAQCLGDYTEQRSAPGRCEIELDWNLVTTPSEPEPGHPGFDVVAAPGAFRTVAARPSFGISYFGDGYVGGRRLGRVAALMFDDADALVEFTYDVIHRSDYSFGGFQLEASGRFEGWIANSALSAELVGSAQLSFSRTSSEVLTVDVVIRRDGVEVAKSSIKRARTVREMSGPGTIANVSVHRDSPGAQLAANVSRPGAGDPSCTYTEQGSAGAYAWTRNAESSGMYPFSSMLSALTITVIPTPWQYGPNPQTQIGSDGAGGGRLLYQRYSNHLFGVRMQLSTPGVADNYHVEQIAGTQAIWVNPDPPGPYADWYATYQPLTHEIYVEHGTPSSEWSVYI